MFFQSLPFEAIGDSCTWATLRPSLRSNDLYNRSRCKAGLGLDLSAHLFFES